MAPAFRTCGKRSAATLGAIGLAALILAPGSPARLTSGVQTASPYPSTATISGLPGTVIEVDVYVTISHNHPSDVDLVLAGPQGQKVMLMSDVGRDDSFGPISNVALLFKDNAMNSLPAAIFGSGTYKPTNLAGSSYPDCNPDRFPSPGPASWSSTLAAFNGTDPNGTWSLYAVDDCGIFWGGNISAWEVHVVTNLTDDMASGSPVSIGAGPFRTGPNLVQNGGFESTCFGATDPCNWIAQYGYATTFQRDTSVVHTGSASLLEGGDAFSPLYANADCVSGVMPGTQYTLSAWYATADPNTTSFSFAAYFYSSNDCTGTDLGSSLGYGLATNTDGAWHHELTSSVAAPAGAVTATVYASLHCGSQPCAGHLDDIALTPQAPTAATATQISATRKPQGVRVSWRIAGGSRLLGFDLYRGAVKLNRALIPAAFDGTRDRSYSYVDRRPGAAAPIRYSLVGVDLAGRRVRLGTAVAR